MDAQIVRRFLQREIDYVHRVQLNTSSVLFKLPAREISTLSSVRKTSWYSKSTFPLSISCETYSMPHIFSFHLVFLLQPNDIKSYGHLCLLQNFCQSYTTCLS